MTALVALHVLSAIVWVGGMFFALLVLRPAAGAMEPPDRLSLWARVFAGFFNWVWAAVALLLATGYWMIFQGWGGFANMPIYLHWMHGIGWVMVLLFLHLWFAPYKRFKAALAAGDLPDAARRLNQIRWIVTVNLVLGLINATLGAAGRYWD